MPYQTRGYAAAQAHYDNMTDPRYEQPDEPEDSDEEVDDER